MDQNQVFRPKLTETSVFGQNQQKPVFPVKIGQNQFFLAKIDKTQFLWPKGFSGQNPVFPAKIDKNQFFWPKSSKPVFPVRIGETHFFWPKSSKPAYLVKIDQSQFFRPKLTQTFFLGGLKASFSGQNRPKPVFPVKIDQNPFGRNWAPPGSFWEFVGSLEPHLRCATFLC